ncbi:MAG: hypothetical protein V4671_24540 [Armatimonadota bacterium]
MSRRFNPSSVRESARALQPLCLVGLVGIVGTVTLLGGCGGGGSSDDPTPTPTPTQSPIVGTPTPTPTPSGSTGPNPTPTPTPTGSGGPSPTPTPTRTPTPTPTPSPTPTPTPSPTPTPPANSLRLDAELTRLQNISAVTVAVVALAPDDRWLLAYDDTPLNTIDATKVSYPADAPVSLRNKLAEISANGGRVRAAALGTGDTWLVIFNEASNNYTQFEYNNIDASMATRLNTLYNSRNYNVNSVAIGADNNTWVITANQNDYFSRNIPTGLSQRLNSLSSNGSNTILDVALGVNNSWAVIYNNNDISAGGISDTLFNFVNNTTGTIQAQDRPVNTIALGQNSTSYALVYSSNVPFVGTLTRAF